MITRFVSIDASTKKTGICLLENGKLTEYRLLDHSEIEDVEERIKVMSLDIIRQLNLWKPHIIYIEDSWSKFNVETTKLLTRVMGVTYGWALTNNCEWNCMLPSRWRKLAGIEQGKKKRSELKQASIDYVKNKYGIDVNDDVADCIAMGDAVCNFYNLISN